MRKKQKLRILCIFMVFLLLATNMQVFAVAVVKANSVSFIGFDGPVRGHAFQPQKFELPSEVTEENALDIYQYQYDILWNLIKNKYPKTTIISLDKQNQLHQSLYEF